MAMGLTQRQAACLRYIGDYVREHRGVAPSYAEIQQQLGFGSRSAVHHTVLRLEERGLLRRIPHRARALEVVGVVGATCPHCGAPLEGEG